MIRVLFDNIKKVLQHCNYVGRVVDRKLISRIVKRVKLGISDPEKLELDRPQSTSFPRKFMNLGSQVFYNIQKSSTRNRLLNIITRQADK